jgi:hypothetical protein
MAGKTTEAHIAYLGKKELAKMRRESTDRDELRQLVKAWIAEKESTKGKSIIGIVQPQKKKRQDERNQHPDNG